MKRQIPHEIQHRSLFWLFRKRLLHETRKYTSGIILTAGVTALFIAMLVVGSSFLSASYRAMGIKGPRVFDINYPSSAIEISPVMPQNVTITCGVSDFYAIEKVRLHYSINFMNTAILLDGVLFESNISGQFYKFTIDITPEPRTYLFFIWANNSAGYFTHEDNGQSFYAIRIVEAGTGTGITPQDPGLPIQWVRVGLYNTTTTRDPRPAMSLLANKESTAWIEINGNASIPRSNVRYYVSIPSANLPIGLNNITFFVQQASKTYKRTMLVTRIDTPLSLASMRPANGSVVFNNLRWINFTLNDYARSSVSIIGNFNKTWILTSYNQRYSFHLDFNNTFGNYSIRIDASDHYGNAAQFNINFTFQQSDHPYIEIVSPKDQSALVNLTIGITVSLSEICDVSVENLNKSGSMQMFPAISQGLLGDVGIIAGWNYINITANNSKGLVNSTILRIFQQPYIIHKFTFKPFAIPGGNLYVDLNFSTNLTIPPPGGSLWYLFDYMGPYETPKSFSIVNGTTIGGIMRGILRAVIDIPVDVEHVLFNFNITFGTSHVVHYDQNGHDFHVPVAYVYMDMQGPTIQDYWIGPSWYSIIPGPKVNATSNEKVKIWLNLFDVTGVKNVSVLFSLNSTFVLNATFKMNYKGGGSNGNGYWDVILPSQVNGSRVYCRIIMYDMLNNSAFKDYDYWVIDILNTNLKNVVPGLLPKDYEEMVLGAIKTLLAIMAMVIVVFIVVFIAINDQNVKREMYREEDRIFILKHVCKLDAPSISKYYYIEQLAQDSIGYGIGTLLGFLVLGPLFVSILKITIVEWTFDFQEMFYFSFITLESWVALLLVLFILCALLLKLVQVDKYVAKMVN